MSRLPPPEPLKLLKVSLKVLVCFQTSHVAEKQQTEHEEAARDGSMCTGP